MIIAFEIFDTLVQQWHFQEHVLLFTYLYEIHSPHCHLHQDQKKIEQWQKEFGSWENLSVGSKPTYQLSHLLWK